MKKAAIWLGGLLVLITVFIFLPGLVHHQWVEVEVSEQHPVPPKIDLLVDDRLDDKHPKFDPLLTDSRRYTNYSGIFEINSSDTVLSLDVPELLPERQSLMELSSSYLVAANRVPPDGVFLLSVNLIDGKAKQFDDGLMATVMLLLAGKKDKSDSSKSVAHLLSGLGSEVAGNSPAFHWLNVAQDLGGWWTNSLSADEVQMKQRFLALSESKPIGFYTWSAELKQVWLLMRYLQQTLSNDVVGELQQVFQRRPELKKAYQDLFTTLARVDNPATEKNLLSPEGRQFLSPMQTPEDALMGRMSQAGVNPLGDSIIEELIRAIRAGRVDLQPRPDSGWYDYQVFALETFLLPERGPEQEHLLLTKKYKQRLLEAFRATITKRRETHGITAKSAAVLPPPPFNGFQLRLEPNPTYYLRMARSYGFLKTVLAAAFQDVEWKQVRGKTENGERGMALSSELEWMQQLFYGCYLLSCEDLGIRPEFLANEPVKQDQACNIAATFINHWQEDADLAVDTRVSIPIAQNGAGSKPKLWCSVGIRVVPMKAGYVQGPQIRLAKRRVDGGNQFTDVPQSDEEGRWQRTFPDSVQYYLLVDQFAEALAPAPLNRQEFRAICDREKTIEQIISALRSGR